MRQSQAAKRDLSCNPETLELSLHSALLLGKREGEKRLQTKQKIEAEKVKHHNSSEFKENVSKGYWNLVILAVLWF